MKTLFRIVNIPLIIAMIGCCAGALAGLIVFFPIAAGAWLLNLVGLLGYEEAPASLRRGRPLPVAAEPERRRVATPEPQTSIPMRHGLS